MIKCISHKRVYLTETLAEEALIGARTNYEYPTGRGPVAVYHCEHCGYYHLTSKGQLNQKLSDYIKGGKLDLEKEANRWMDKIKRR